MASKGILFLYSESKSIDYKRLADLSARLAEAHLKLPTTIIEVNTEQKGVRPFRWTDNEIESVEWNNYDRCDAWNLSPYDETLLLDVDYCVQTDKLAHVFETYHDFLCHRDSWDVSGNDVFRHNKFLSQNGHDMYWATVVHWKRSDFTEKVFTTWHMVQQNFEYYSKLFGFPRTPYRNDFALSIAYQICNGYSAGKTFPWSMPALSSSDSIIDYNDRWLVKYEYKEGHNVLRYKGDLHVMNKRCLLEQELYSKLWSSV